MRTTVRLADALLEQARREARRRGETLTSLIEKGLRHELSTRPTRRKSKVEVPVFRGGTGEAPGIDLTNSAAVWDILDGAK